MPLSIEDRLAINDLLARYNHAIDSGDAEGWAATFASDGTFESRGDVHAGADALRAFASGFAERMPGTRHWNNNVLVEGGGDEASATCYLLLMRGTEAISEGKYVDALRKVDGEWRFTSRKVVRE